MEEKKFISPENLLLYDTLSKLFINDTIEGKIFVGSKTEYEDAYANGKIQNNALVILVDDDVDSDNINTTSILGKAILGKMILSSN